MKTQEKHEQSGCVDYLQHSWQSCPQNQTEQRDTAQPDWPETTDIEIITSARDLENLRAHAERLAEACEKLMTWLTQCDDYAKQSDAWKLATKALSAWEGAK